jgi:hypothetical protein
MPRGWSDLTEKSHQGRLVREDSNGQSTPAQKNATRENPASGPGKANPFTLVGTPTEQRQMPPYNEFWGHDVEPNDARALARRTNRQLMAAVNSVEGFSSPPANHASTELRQAAEAFANALNMLAVDAQSHAHNACLALTELQTIQEQLAAAQRQLVDAEDRIRACNWEIRPRRHPEYFGELTPLPGFCKGPAEGQSTVMKTSSAALPKDPPPASRPEITPRSSSLRPENVPLPASNPASFRPSQGSHQPPVGNESATANSESTNGDSESTAASV